MAKRYGSLPGTLPLDVIHFEHPTRRYPDLVVGYDYDEAVVVSGARGIEWQGQSGSRGMHGTFSPVDVHNTLVAFGPDFARGFSDPLPSANVDVAPTIARILGLPFEHAKGRPLLEALRGGLPTSDYVVTPAVISPETRATGLTMKLPTSPSGAHVDRKKSTYTIDLRTKTVTVQGKSFTYFDSAKAIRQ